MDNRKENVPELFERFVDAADAQEAAGDIRRGDELFAGHAALRPSAEVISAVKAGVAAACEKRRQRNTTGAFFKVVAVAAVLFIATAVAVKLFEERGTDSARQYATIIPSVVWESDDVAVDDTELAVLAAEVEQMKAELVALELGESEGNGNGGLSELEAEFIEIDTVFWKG